MPRTRPKLALAHSPDPDDAFMWWPITGKIAPFPPDTHVTIPLSADGALDLNALPRAHTPPAIDTGRFEYRAFPADISLLNQHAARSAPALPLLRSPSAPAEGAAEPLGARPGEAPSPALPLRACGGGGGASPPGEASARGSHLFPITALSFRAYCDVHHLYAITACGSSFGHGFGPKVVARPPSQSNSNVESPADLRRPNLRIAIPGTRTTAFLTLAMLLGKDALADSTRFVEMPFEKIIPAVARGDVDAGLVIHEGQVLYEQAGLRLIVDLGQWWAERTGLPLPLGANAIRRDLESIHGPGTLREITRTLRASIDHALAHRAESLEYTRPFALANTLRASGLTSARSNDTTPHAADLPQIDRYVAMYVNDWTLDMRAEGREAVLKLLRDGHALNLCPDPGDLDIVPCN